MSAVHLEFDELAAVDANRPGRVDLDDHLALQLEDAVGGVVGGGGILAALLIPALRDVGNGLGRYGLHLAEEVLKHVVPMREHVEHDAPAILGPVVPAGPLGRQQITFEDPVPELPAHREDASEEPGVDEPLKIEKRWK